MKQPTELQIQIALFEWASLMEPLRPELKGMFAIPNGGKRDPRTGAVLKASGAKAGVPDICLPVARGHYHGLWIELKRPGGKPSELQRSWIEFLARHGYKAVVRYGLDDTISTIEDYLARPYEGVKL